eukprot:gnl/TRDRNA2_/TRDRNA2_163296_c0_seq1.p1 gnl/TRDRNA2_/TRDRNA2_163296_c0~~gnl/TRDRNA2_/TRDRNA2_163296_c0_seq1.p1  ORF type:complete len:277 (+),score=35.42 gnl/TRDRNA2_/TRDRNA2_163296_c0_seq1:1-831(+)
MLPLCGFRDAEARLELVHVAVSHVMQCEGLIASFECMQAAATETLTSSRLHSLLRMVLQVANYINHGSSSNGAKTFSVQSLRAFAQFKVGRTSTLHYLCFTLCDEEFVSGLKGDLRNTMKASRLVEASLHEDVNIFNNLLVTVETLRSSLSGSDNAWPNAGPAAGETASDTFSTRTASLMASLRDESHRLKSAADLARARVAEAQRFFGDQSKELPPAEEFFLCIAEFVHLLGLTSAEVRTNAEKQKLWSRTRGRVNKSPVHSSAINDGRVTMAGG